MYKNTKNTRGIYDVKTRREQPLSRRKKSRPPRFAKETLDNIQTWKANAGRFSLNARLEARRLLARKRAAEKAAAALRAEEKARRKQAVKEAVERQQAVRAAEELRGRKKEKRPPTIDSHLPAAISGQHKKDDRPPKKKKSRRKKGVSKSQRSTPSVWSSGFETNRKRH
jgi:hypothetical protein